MNDLIKTKETAILIGCYLDNRDEERTRLSMEELHELADTAGVEVLDVITQNRDRVDSAWYLGTGKIDEIAQRAEELDVDVIIFNDELSPSQTRNLDKVFDCKVIDRTQLILDIFAGRAQSREGKIQVELAQYNYLLPRLAGQGKQLSRLGGGIGTRGPGETKLESDRRHIRKRISELKQQLEDTVRTRQLHRERRKKNNVFQIALVGYTNAGKSTILNKLTNANTLQEDKLFATLDPTTRQLELPSGLDVLLTDTVGFIQDLPTSLVAAFRSTLEGVKEADLILHVVDCHHPDFQIHMEVVDRILRELKAEEIPQLVVFNKADLLAEGSYLPHADESILISAMREDDLKRLLTRIESFALQSFNEMKLRVPVERGDILSLLHRDGVEMEQEFNEEEAAYLITVRVNKDNPIYGRIAPFLLDKPETVEESW
ncbi:MULTISPECIES: GTPase HflX [Brevibacillus]|uniref:GTPase HflX n=1 Tax=Brevibacillus TaxID=55080 RepID=UPI000D0F6306|nr:MULTISPECIES: GTPase HflX [Brevibacillus]PSJ66919.1 GTPase HflX [Brevibacillus brevis]RED36067.1 GTP-binding protein HflX [Brevibacillus brevis]TQK75153.1 GTP-binding protein HflX [Brevibacillus sp. AG162]VEF88823.1 GTP-binding protein HflX [Brevibacillus brevis]GEC88554.1 GTPase HflX [Brevibacillus brevis]